MISRQSSDQAKHKFSQVKGTRSRSWMPHRGKRFPTCLTCENVKNRWSVQSAKRLSRLSHGRLPAPASDQGKRVFPQVKRFINLVRPGRSDQGKHKKPLVRGIKPLTRGFPAF